MFTIHHTQAGNLPALEMLTATEDTYVVGQALKLASGGLAACGATDKPDYISMQAGDGGTLTVLPVCQDTVYACTSTATPTVGTKVTLSTDGLSVTATTTGGVATVLAVRNGEVLVKF